MNALLTPASLAEVADAVRSTAKLLPVGAGTKPRLSNVEASRLSLRGLSGVIEYDPSEFTFTALAGTPLRDISAALAEKGQYLPFDPMLAAAGATIGGTVAAGLSGPGRFRYGGLRDFILCVRFVDGLGRILRLGGKVVKNAAGFDLPKFFVGSLGRFGVLGEITFKVFPRPADSLTLQLAFENHAAAAKALIEASVTRYELDALDLLPDGRSLLLRLAAPAAALEPMSREILARWPGKVVPSPEAAALWSSICEFQWAHPNGILLKSAIAPSSLAFLESLSSLPDARVHVSSGGNVAYISLPSPASVSALDQSLQSQNLRAVVLRGEAPLWLGAISEPAITAAVKNALDPDHRFPEL